jgi:hypothetical protein
MDNRRHTGRCNARRIGRLQQDRRERSWHLSDHGRLDMETRSGPGRRLLGGQEATATVSGAKLMDSFDELKSATKKLYKDLKVVKETATELEMAGMSLVGKPEVYRAIVAGDKKFCIVEVGYTAGTADDVWTIARTLKGAK